MLKPNNLFQSTKKEAYIFVWEYIDLNVMYIFIKPNIFIITIM